jgi:hypothetical protein
MCALPLLLLALYYREVREDSVSSVRVSLWANRPGEEAREVGGWVLK